MPRFSSSKFVFQVAGLGFLAIALTACAPRVDPRGNLVDAELLEELSPGDQSKDEVAELLGSPSSIANFGEETWYYISKRTETVAFFEPDVKERQVIIIKFGKDGRVSKIEKLGMQEARAVSPVERETPSSGNEIGVFQQLFGNLGRFNK